MPLEQSSWSQEKMAEEVPGRLTRDIIGQALRLLTFQPELRELVWHDTIMPTHAEALARLASEPSALSDVITMLVNQKLTAKETEQFVGELVRKQALRRDKRPISATNAVQTVWMVLLLGDDSLSHLVERIKELRGSPNQPRRASEETKN
jgi:ParB-like chromosome segregation protein Spo0J